jgi:hypothetical protein
MARRLVQSTAQQMARVTPRTTTFVRARCRSDAVTLTRKAEATYVDHCVIPVQHRYGIVWNICRSLTVPQLSVQLRLGRHVLADAGKTTAFDKQIMMGCWTVHIYYRVDEALSYSPPQPQFRKQVLKEIPMQV